jgi:PAS domain S-box-containing protein
MAGSQAPSRSAAPAAHLLRKNQERVLRVWEKNVLREIPEARQKSRSVLRDHLPYLLDDIASALERGRTELVISSRRHSAAEHGRQRQKHTDFNLEQVLHEFRLLRGAVFEVLESFQPLDRGTRDLILETMDLALAETAREFVERQLSHEREIQAEVEIAARRLRGLHAVTEAALVSHISVDDLLNELADQIRELFHSDTAAILLLDPRTQELVVRAGRGLEEDRELQTRIPIGRGVLGSVFVTREPRIIQDLRAEREVVSDVLRERITSLMVAPLRLLGEPIGAVHVGTVEHRSFTPDDLTLLDLIANRIATAIHHARLMELQRKSENRLKLMSETIPQLLWTATPDGKSSGSNTRWSEYTGLKAQKHEMQWLDVVHPDDRAATLQRWQEAQTGLEFSMEHRFRRKDGTYEWFLSRATPVRDESGRIVEWFGTSTGIDEQKRAQADLESEREMRERFVSTLTHDLRNPLSAAKLTAQIIARNPERRERIQMLAQRIQDSLGRADQMIQDLLDANRIRAGKPLPIELEGCDFRKIADEAREELAVVYGDRFKIEGPNRLEGVASPKDIRRALENLMTNAVKYGSPDRPVQIRLSEEKGCVRIAVHNSDSYIAPQDQEGLFEPFARSRGSKEHGWGLGLALVRGVARAHEGEIQVESTRRAGTTFTLILPRNPA